MRYQNKHDNLGGGHRVSVLWITMTDTEQFECVVKRTWKSYNSRNTQCGSNGRGYRRSCQIVASGRHLMKSGYIYSAASRATSNRFLKRSLLHVAFSTNVHLVLPDTVAKTTTYLQRQPGGAIPSRGTLLHMRAPKSVGREPSGRHETERRPAAEREASYVGGGSRNKGNEGMVWKRSRWDSGNR